MTSTLRSQFEIVESLPWSPGDWATAAYKARESADGAPGEAQSGFGRIVLLRLLEPSANTPAVRDASERYAGLPAHPNILTHFGFTELPDDGQFPAGFYLISEYVRGISLRERIRRVAPFSLAVSLDVAISVTQALLRARASGLEQGDLRPESIVLTPDGEVKVADFGLGRAIRQASGEAVAQESAAQRIALILFEMLTAQAPDGSAAALSPRAANSSVPEAIDRIVLKAALSEEAGGYVTLSALLAELETAREELRRGRMTANRPSVPLDVQRPANRQPAEILPPQRTVQETEPGEPQQAPRERLQGETTMAGVVKTPRGRPEPSDDGYDDEDGYYEDDRRASRGPGATLVRALIMTLIVAVAVAAVFCCAYFFMLVNNVPSDITVPNLIGKQYTDAQTMATQQHFHLVQTDHGNSDTWPVGAIYQQTPMPGRSIKSGKDVDVFVSDGPSLLDVPDLSQMTLIRAKGVLSDSGLPVGSLDYQYDEVTPKGIVTAQQPAAGSKVARATAVNLTISNGPPPPAAPDDVSATSTVPGEVDITWDSVPSASTYNVYRDGKKIASALPETTYSDVGLDDNTTYSYTVTGINSNGESQPSKPQTAVAQPGSPTAPTSAGGSTPDNSVDATQPDDAGSPAQTAPPSVATDAGAPKPRQFEVRFRVPRGGKHNIQIEVQDTTGTSIVYDEDHYSGEVIDQSSQAFGNKVIIRIFIDGKLAKQMTK